MALDPDTGVPEGDLIGRPVPGVDQNDYTHSDSGNSGNDRQISGGTAGDATQQSGPGAPAPTK